MTWYVVLCRTCDDKVRTFPSLSGRMTWWAEHYRETRHHDFWLADSDDTEH